MWHTLVWTDGHGGFVRLHLEAGIRSVRVSVPYGKAVVFCAYPLGELNPWGGVLHPLGRDGRVVLTLREGGVARLLQSLSGTAPEPISRLVYPNLRALLDEMLGDDWSCVDYTRLGTAILNGSLERGSIRSLEPFPVVLEDLPTGRWVSEERDDLSFWFDRGSMSVQRLSLFPGLHRFLNRESHMELHILVDTETEQVFVSMREPHMELL